MKTPIHKHVLIIILILSAIVSNAQENYVTALLIDLKGDTIYGFINNERWLNNPQTIKFKDKNGAIRKVGPDEIRGFFVGDNLFFISERVNYDTTSNKTGSLPTSSIPLYKEERLFLKVNVFSDLSLLSLTKNGRLHFFLKQVNQMPLELINHRFLYKDRILENRGFIAQLSEYLKDCSQIIVNDVAPYSMEYLGNLIMLYNDCKKVESTLYDEKEKTITRAGFIGDNAYDQYNSSFDGGIGYGVGGFASFYFPDKNYRLSLNTELAYRKTADQKSSTESYKIQSIQWSNLIRYACFPKYRNILFGAGFSYSLGLPDEYRYRNSKILSDRAEPFISILADVSVILQNNIILGLRYESGDSINMDYDFGNGNTDRPSAFRFSLGWQF